MPSTGGSSSRGQASVELALVLPLVFALLLLVVQLGLVVRDQILVVHAAREGARAAAVQPDGAAARDAVLRSGRLDPARVSVALRRNDRTDPRTVTVTVTYRAATDVPLVGHLVDDVVITEEVTMRLETP